MKETILQNIDLSSQVIVFDQETKQGELTITNKHPTLGTTFKIKVTKLNIIDVKPAKGFIKPQEKVVINFKISANMSQQEMEAIQNSDKFLIQFLNITNQQATRQEVQGFWKAYKNNTANLQHGYGCYRVFMNLTGKKKLSASNIKSQTMNSHLYKSIGSRSGVSRNQQEDNRQKALKDEQLSKKYTELKDQQEQLRQKRQSIFKTSETPVKTKSKKGGKMKAIIVFCTISTYLVLLFLLAFLSGNYVRSTMIKVKLHQTQKEQKKSFFHLPFFD